jgi:hypothetical protein
MTTIKRLLRRLDGYTLDAFNAPQTHERALQRAARRGGRHAAR